MDSALRNWQSSGHIRYKQIIEVWYMPSSFFNSFHMKCLEFFCHYCFGSLVKFIVPLGSIKFRTKQNISGVNNAKWNVWKVWISSSGSGLFLLVQHKVALPFDQPFYAFAIPLYFYSSMDIILVEYNEYSVNDTFGVVQSSDTGT